MPNDLIEATPDAVAPPMKPAAIIVLIEALLQLQGKAGELAAQQLELTRQLETETKRTHEVAQKTLAEQHDVGGEA
ncbi:MAG: hypothetical protein ACKV0T_07325 [Planctomycetales bacterium]